MCLTEEVGWSLSVSQCTVCCLPVEFRTGKNSVRSSHFHAVLRVSDGNGFSSHLYFGASQWDGVGFSKLKVCAWISQGLIHTQVFSNLGSYQFLPVCSLQQRPLWPRTELGVGDIILCAVKTSSGFIYGAVFLSLPLFFADSSAHSEILPLETASPNHLLRTGSFSPQWMSHALQENFLAISYFLWVCLDAPHLCHLLLVHTVTWLSTPGSPPRQP